MKVLSFVVADEAFAVDASLVQTVTRKLTVTPVPVAPVEISGIANLKGRVVTVFNLYELLAYKERRKDQRAVHAVNAVVFKSFSGSDDLIAVTIGQPGNLIDIDDDAVRRIDHEAGQGENIYVSEIAEAHDTLYRIVDIGSIMEKYKIIGENAAETDKNGGSKDE